MQKEFLFKLKKSFLGYFINIRIGEITNLYNREINFVAESYRLLLIIIARLIIFFLLLIFLLINETLLTFSTLILTFLLILIMKKFYNIIENNANDLINEQQKVSSSFTFFINNIFSIRNTIYQDSHINEIKDQTKNWIKYLIKNIRYKLIVSSFIEPIFIIMIIFSIFIIFQIQSVIPANYLVNLGILLRFARHFLSIQNSYIKILNWKRYVKSKKFHDKLLQDFLEDQANQTKNFENFRNFN